MKRGESVLRFRVGYSGNADAVSCLVRMKGCWSMFSYSGIVWWESVIALLLSKLGRELGMESTLFVAAPAVVAGLVEVEQRDSLSPTSAQGVTVDPGGSTL
ncbi:hypothetical protein V6N13_024125 [Hibiscus sabdariffa]